MSSLVLLQFVQMQTLILYTYITLVMKKLFIFSILFLLLSLSPIAVAEELPTLDLEVGDSFLVKEKVALTYKVNDTVKADLLNESIANITITDVYVNATEDLAQVSYDEVRGNDSMSWVQNVSDFGWFDMPAELAMSASFMVFLSDPYGNETVDFEIGNYTHDYFAMGNLTFWEDVVAEWDAMNDTEEEIIFDYNMTIVDNSTLHIDYFETAFETEDNMTMMWEANISTVVDIDRNFVEYANWDIFLEMKDQNNASISVHLVEGWEEYVEPIVEVTEETTEEATTTEESEESNLAFVFVPVALATIPLFARRVRKANF